MCLWRTQYMWTYNCIYCVMSVLFFALAAMSPSLSVPTIKYSVSSLLLLCDWIILKIYLFWTYPVWFVHLSVSCASQHLWYHSWYSAGLFSHSLTCLIMLVYFPSLQINCIKTWCPCYILWLCICPFVVYMDCCMYITQLFFKYMGLFRSGTWCPEEYFKHLSGN